MTTIDHAAEARKRIDEAHQGLMIGDADAREAATLDYLEANAHATLALVDAQREANEQARIANVLTLHRYEHERGIAPDRSYLYEPDTDTLRDDIKKGLGL